GGHESAKTTLQLAEPLWSSVIGTCRRFANTLLSSSEATRHQMSELVWAIRRIATPALTDEACRLSAEDLARWRRAPDERARNPVGPVDPDASMSYSRTYCDALAAIADDKAIEQLKIYLADPLFGHDAALALRHVWDKQQNTVVTTHFIRGPNFSEVKTRREER